MALRDVRDALVTAFTARACDVPVLLGEQFIADHSDGTRIVLTMTQDTFGNRNATQTLGPKYMNPRPIMTRTVGAVAHLWACANVDDQPAEELLEADMLVLDALVNIFTASLHSVSQGCFTLGTGAPTTDKAIHVRRGLVYLLPFTVDIPVIDIAWPAYNANARTYRAEPDVIADIAVQTLLGDPPTYQTGVSFETPDPE